MPATVHRLRTSVSPQVIDAANDFLDTIRSPNTRRSYTTAVVKTANHLMGTDPTTGLPNFGRLLADIGDDEIGDALEALWGDAAVNTWNARRAAVLAWLAWCRENGRTAPAVPDRAKRCTPPDSDTPVRSRAAIDRLIARRDIHIREKTLWRMLYETCARAEELLGVNIEDLDLAGRCAPVKSKGAKPRTRRRGATHAEHVLETVYWDAGTARLLPRLIKDRTHGPLFVGHRKPGPGKYLGDRDVCPDTGYARLSYEQARALLDDATATDGPGTGWDLHELRHSGLTQLGEAGASLLELMAKSRHRKPENLRRYFKPSPQAMRDLTSLIGPNADRRR
ncbi:site-specific integrase [Nocardia sp. CDC186]|uniref:Site-specific integrase n=1 Tax=Nocardia implantans TaxID=3108168 RepID=A0ABU6AZY0_9NOCA|nr:MULTISPECIES: site-specific integrase [unclassified Nocardia]MBF6191363.1 site-specific integrase [Nocardia beijingensis]MEA3533004.1 site-specific integrase [Nocardia sp. CDC192]MEB3512936.1 site-specific integrase [Nocardia sp. CDC186]